MSQGNRLHHLALRRCLIAAFVLVSAVALAQEPQSPTESAESSSDTARQESQPKPPSPAPEPQVPAPVNQEADHGTEYYSREDLDAQRRMAVAAEELVDLTGQQIIVIAVEATLLAITIFFTAWAAIAASRAAKAAQDAVYWNIRAERPRLILKTIMPEGFENARNAPADDVPLIVAARATVENTGTRTAIILYAQMTHSWGLPPVPPEPEDGNKDWIGNTNVPAGESYEFPGQLVAFQLQFDDSQLVFDYQKELFLYGFVRYADVHGTTWRAGFAFEYHPLDITKGSAEGMFFNCGPTSYWYDIEEKREQSRKRRWPWQKASHV